MVYGYSGGLLLQQQIKLVNQLLALDRIDGGRLLVDLCLDLPITVLVVVAYGRASEIFVEDDIRIVDLPSRTSRKPSCRPP